MRPEAKRGHWGAALKVLTLSMVIMVTMVTMTITMRMIMIVLMMTMRMIIIVSMMINIEVMMVPMMNIFDIGDFCHTTCVLVLN